MNQDPVCGKEINLDHTRYESFYQGQTYYFCSAACKEQFDAHPERYAKRHAA
jgi:YHS domain-containing protein